MPHHPQLFRPKYREAFFIHGRWCGFFGGRAQEIATSMGAVQVPSMSVMELSTAIIFVQSRIQTGWWFGTFFIFPYIGKNHPNWLIFFRGVQTTNQQISGRIMAQCQQPGNLRDLLLSDLEVPNFAAKLTVMMLTFVGIIAPLTLISNLD